MDDQHHFELAQENKRFNDAVWETDKVESCIIEHDNDHQDD